MEQQANRDGSAGSREHILDTYRTTRQFTEALTRPLATEDYVVQTMADVSPAKWHLGHTSWFFEMMILVAHQSGYQPYHPRYNHIFNSYYECMGDRVLRPQRGHLSRPTVKEILAYRETIDSAIEAFIQGSSNNDYQSALATMVIGLHHEQQHQELILTDIKHVFATNPLRPAYDHRDEDAQTPAAPLQYIAVPGGLVEVGADTTGFAFDNEKPRHRVFLNEFKLANRCVTVGEYLEFIDAGGYRSAQYWLADGWDWVQCNRIHAPLYWLKSDGRWHTMTLAGPMQINLNEPVCHVSYYEADAFARWANKRLPTEFEWEHAATLWGDDGSGAFLERGEYHPRTTPVGQRDMLGNVWEWTASPYVPYPGYRCFSGHLAEYNAKFMSNQLVLRGGSCATPRSHIRVTYRNFFQAEKRWQFTGFRLAE